MHWRVAPSERDEPPAPPLPDVALTIVALADVVRPLPDVAQFVPTLVPCENHLKF